MPSRLLVALISVLLLSCACSKVPGDSHDSKSEASSPVPVSFSGLLDFRAHPEHRVA